MSAQVKAVARRRRDRADEPTATRALQALQSDHVHVRQERCLLVRNRNAECLRCAQACTSGCISYNEQTKMLEIDQARCVGCGTCATACPTCALEARDPNDTELLARLQDALNASASKTVAIACEKAGIAQDERAVRLTCLGRIDESALLQLAAWGAREVTLTCGSCSACEHKPGRAVVEEVCESANTLLGLWGSTMHVELKEVERAAEPTGLPAQETRADRTATHGKIAQVDQQIRTACADRAATQSAIEQADQQIRTAGTDNAVEQGTATRDEGRLDFSDETDAGRTATQSEVEQVNQLIQSAGAGKVAEHDTATRDEDRPNLSDEASNGEATTTDQVNRPLKRLKVMADGTLPHFVPDRRERLLDALADLGEGPTDSRAMARTRLWGHVVIDTDKCTSCRMCATFCPTGAIVKFDAPDGTFGVDHYAADCVKCLCCQTICRAQAIVVEDAVPANVLVNAVPERHVMRPVRVPKGGVHSIMNSMRDLLGLPEVFER